MKKQSKILTLMLTFMALILTGCNNTNQSSSSLEDFSTSELEEVLKPNIATDEAYNLINDNKNNPNFILLDVRTQGEYDEFYIEGSIHRPLKEEEEFINSISDISKDNRILVYCRTQNRSRTAFQYMKNAGYKKVQYMEGGITAWAKEGKPLVEPLKDEKNAIIVKNDVKHNYLTTESLQLELKVKKQYN